MRAVSCTFNIRLAGFRPKFAVRASGLASAQAACAPHCGPTARLPQAAWHKRPGPCRKLDLCPATQAAAGARRGLCWLTRPGGALALALTRRRRRRAPTLIWRARSALTWRAPALIRSARALTQSARSHSARARSHLARARSLGARSLTLCASPTIVHTNLYNHKFLQRDKNLVLTRRANGTVDPQNATGKAHKCFNCLVWAQNQRLVLPGILNACSSIFRT